MSDEEEQHEVFACYSLSPVWRIHVPHLRCSCGFSATERTWEEAGAGFDVHRASLEGDDGK